MIEILFNLFIFPIYTLIHIVFDCFNSMSVGNIFISILFVSFIVNLLCLPMYNQAEKYQREERDIQKKLEPKVKSIKKNFNGDERFMILSTYYRQNNYHPIMALRSSLSLLIQIPFFIAAYMFFSHLAVFNGMPLGIIRDLSKPDGLLNLFGFSINILPFVMTFINIAAAMVYSKGLPKKELIQLYTIPFVFLVLLYNSASGLVLYWTLNNCFSLIKNLALNSKNPVKYLLITIGMFVAGLLFYLIHNIIIYPATYLPLVMPFLYVVLAIFLVGIFVWAYFDKIKSILEMKNNVFIYILALITLALWVGFFIPTNIISSSPEDFALISDNISNPLLLIGFSLTQAVGVFIIWGSIFYYFSTYKIKNVLLILSLSLLCVFILNTLMFTGNLGLLSTDFRLTLDDLEMMQINSKIINVIACIIVSFIPVILFKFKKNILIKNGLSIILITVLIFSGYSCFKIEKAYKNLILMNKNINNEAKDIIKLTSNGKNVIVIFLDRAMGIQALEIFKEFPEIEENFEGFVLYPNTVSFGRNTLTSYQALMGGYEYHPIRMNEDNGQSLVEKHNESLLVLPLLFRDKGFETVVIEPSYESLKVTGDGGKIFKERGIGYYNFGNNLSKYVNNLEPDDKKIYEYLAKDISSDTTKNNLFPFCLVIASPTVCKNSINNLILKNSDLTVFDTVLINDFLKMTFLKKISNIDKNNKNSYVVINSLLTHVNKFDRDYSAERMFINKETFNILLKYFNYLKENNTYDNTRIIIVGDHGDRDQENEYMSKSYTQFNPLLMVKDFNSKEPLRVDMTFMTNADMPFIAAEGIIDEMINPFTKNKMKDFVKKDKVEILSDYKNKTILDNPKRHTYIDKKDTIIEIKDNIFIDENWQEVMK